MRERRYEGRLKDWRTYEEPEPSKECVIVSLALGGALGLVLLWLGWGWVLP